VLILFQFLLVWKHTRRKPKRERAICVCACVYLSYRWHAPSSRHLRALLSACGRCSFGVLFSSCACVCRCRGCCSLSVCVCVTCWSFYTTHTTITFSFEPGILDTCCGADYLPVPTRLEARAPQARARARHLCVCVCISHIIRLTPQFSFETGHVDTRRGGNLVAVPPGLEIRAPQAQNASASFVCVCVSLILYNSHHNYVFFWNRARGHSSWW